MPQRNAVRYNVYVDEVLRQDFELISANESVGADRLDVATFEVILEHLEGYNPAAWLNLEIEVERSGGSGEIVHFGKSTLAPILLQPGGETIQVVSRTELFHLGEKVNGYWVWNPVTAAPVIVDGELIFNPLIDGLIYGNLNNTQETAGGDPLFLDPESVRSGAAITFQGADVAPWSLAEAVYYLLWSLNTAQTYAANETLVNLEAVFDDPATVIRDVRMPKGTYLAEALDMLLTPLGYQWRINREEIGSRKFAFWKRGAGGTLRTVKHQVIGSTLSLANTNVETAGITFDISSLGNEVTVLGGFGEYELTAELCRGWATAADPPAGIADELSMDHPDFADVQNVLRKWVLNEAGDYIGLRTEIDGIFPTALRTALGSAGLLGQFIGRRRQLLPTLTQDDDGTPIGKILGVEVEYSNVSGTPEWHSVMELSGGAGCSLLKKEAGLYFACERLPDEFLVDPANLRIRVTFTLQGDFRLTGGAPRQAASPNDDVVPVIVSAPDRFRYRQVTTISKYTGGASPSLAVNDTTAIAAFAVYARDTWDLMRCGGTIQLEGLDHEYLVGDRIQKIAGKEISFEAKASSGMYPQIVAIERNATQQVMTLHLEHFRDPLTLPTPGRGTSKRFAPQNFRGRTI